MTTWLTPLRGKCNTLKNPSGGAERSIIQKALLGPHWPRCHNSSRTQMKIQLVLCKLLNMVQSLQSCFCVCVCVCDFLKNKDFMPFEHAISLYSVLHNLPLSLIGQDWVYDKNRILCHECRILSMVNAVFHVFWEFLSIWWAYLWS